MRGLTEPTSAPYPHADQLPLRIEKPIIRSRRNIPAGAAEKSFALWRKAGFVDQQPGPASRFEVRVLEAVVTHEVTVAQVQRWLELGSSNPNEEAKRKRLRELITAT